MSCDPVQLSLFGKVNLKKIEASGPMPRTQLGSWGRGCIRLLGAFAVTSFWICQSAGAASSPPAMTVPGQFNVGATGAATYAVPIAVPPGTAGIAPTISLSYSSTNGDGIVGLGWRLEYGVDNRASAKQPSANSAGSPVGGHDTAITSALSDGSTQIRLPFSVGGQGQSSGTPNAIYRCPRTIAEDGVRAGVHYDLADRFCMEGSRLVLISGTYGTDGSQYRTEVETFAQIIAHGTAGNGPAWFEVRLKSGLILEFGNTSDSQILASGTQTARTWALNKLKDRKENYFTVTYKNDSANGQYYPMRIDYTGNANKGTAAYNSVQFFYSDRAPSAIVPLYEGGSLQKITTLLSNVKTFQGTNLVHDYRFLYNNPASGASHYELQSVTLCDGSGACLAPTTFGWQGSRDNPAMSAAASPSNYWPSWFTGDFNGDGLTDYVTATGDSTCAYGDSTYWGQAGGGDIYLKLQSGGYVPSGMTIGSSTPACFPVGVIPQSLGQLYPSLTDLKGDGFTDVVVFPGYDTQSGYAPDNDPYNTPGSYINDGHGHFNFVGLPFTQPRSEYHLGDYNGDGRTDVYVDAFGEASHSGSGSRGLQGCTTCGSNIYTSKGDGTFNMGSNITYVGGVVPVNEGVFADFSGDGCTSLWIEQTDNVASSILTPCKASGSPVTPLFATSSPDYVPVFGDFNGDGIVDVLNLSPYNNSPSILYLGTGTGFTVGITLPNSNGWGGYQAVTGDFNGDGKTDLALIADCVSHYCPNSPHLVMLSTGTGFTQLAMIPNTFQYARAIQADWNNDGASDLWILPSRPNSGTPMQYLFSYVPELMTSISSGIGATTTITYDRLNQNGAFYKKCSNGTFSCGDAYPTKAVDGPVYVVSRVDFTDGIGGTYNTSYAYTGAKADLAGRGFLGFSTIAVTDSRTNNVTTTNYRQDYPFIGAVASQTVTSGSTVVFSVVNTYCPDAGPCPGAPGRGADGVTQYLVLLGRSVTTTRELGAGSDYFRVTNNYTYDGYGNLAFVATSNEALNADGTVGDWFKTLVTNTFTNDTTNWLIGLLNTSATQATSKSSSDITRHVSFGYDSVGALTQQIVEPGDGAHQAVTSYTLDGFGNRTQVTVSGPNIATRSTTKSYDSYGQFQTGGCDALNHCESLAYDVRFGSPTSHTDANGLVTTWSYDTLGRPHDIMRPDGVYSWWSYAYCPGGNGCPDHPQDDPNAAFYSAFSTIKDGNYIAPIQLQLYDSLSREVTTVSQGFDGGWVFLHKQYDANGHLFKQGRWCDYTACHSVATALDHWTAYAYDALGRVTQVTQPNGRVDIVSYSGLTSTATQDSGGNNQTVTIVKNAQELQASVTDSLNHTTSYVYDAFGDLATITDPAGNVTSNNYDVRGNRTATSDPDMGSWNYYYDALGQLTSQTDAKGQTSSLNYDVLGRLVGATEGAFTRTFTYDSAAHGIGLLASMSSSDSTNRSFAYDSLSRPSSATLTVDGVNYTTASAYNANGRIDTLTYPSGFATKYVYNAMGYLTQILNNASNTVLWQANARDAEMHLTSQTFGNNVTQSNSFDANTGLLTNIRAGTNDTVAAFDYSFDNIGNLTYRSDNYAGTFERFCYDNLNRLTDYSAGNAVSSCSSGPNYRTVHYDAIGNITGKADIGYYNYPSAGQARPHAISSITGVANGTSNPSYSYDANGNMTAGAGRSVSYTVFNMTTSITQGTTSLAYAYDATHNRVKQTENKNGAVTTTTYVDDLASGFSAEKIATSSADYFWNDYIVIPSGIAFDGRASGVRIGMHMTRVTNNNVANFTNRYFVLDHLGSTAVITDDSGAVSERLAYDPWGKRRYANGNDDTAGAIHSQTNRGFTSHEHIEDVGLINMNARIYDPALGRFMSADPVTTTPYDAQSLNRYAYVDNRPLSLTDPSGNTPLDVGFLFVDALSLGKDIANGASAGDVAMGALNVAIDVAAVASPVPGVSAVAHGIEGAAKVAEVAGKAADVAKTVEKAAPSFDVARSTAFEKAGMTDASKVEFSKMDQKTGTIVEFKGEGGAKVGYDGPHQSPGPHHDTQHISWQSSGKRGSGRGQRGNEPYSGQRHPSRPDRKDQ